MKILSTCGTRFNPGVYTYTQQWTVIVHHHNLHKVMEMEYIMLLDYGYRRSSTMNFQTKAAKWKQKFLAHSHLKMQLYFFCCEFFSFLFSLWKWYHDCISPKHTWCLSFLFKNIQYKNGAILCATVSNVYLNAFLIRFFGKNFKQSKGSKVSAPQSSVIDGRKKGQWCFHLTKTWISSSFLHRFAL